jgi:hypothetical protein
MVNYGAKAQELGLIPHTKATVGGDAPRQPCKHQCTELKSFPFGLGPSRLGA